MTGPQLPWNSDRPRVLPVFISSTFRDMDYERDVINRVVLPEVNATLRARGHNVELYAVDLRWGIEVDEELTPTTRDRMILEVCAGEVRRCRPLFVGMIGERYGWLAPPEIEAAARRAAGFADVGFPLSAMALEILTATSEAARDGVAPILLARRVLDAGEAGPATSPDAYLLDRLAEHVVASGCVLRRYSARWRPDPGSPDGRRRQSEEFAPMLIDALLHSVNAVVVPQAVDDSWLDAEVALHRRAAADEAAHFIGREADLALIDGYWSNRDMSADFEDDARNPLWGLRRQHQPQALAIIGPSGSGKSALLAAVAVSLSCANELDKLTSGIRSHADAADHPGQNDAWSSDGRAYVHVGLTPASERLPVCLLVLLAQLNPACATEIASATSPESVGFADVRAAWHDQLSDVVGGFGPLVVVDGLDRLKTDVASQSVPLAWMPLALGDKVRFLVSATDEPPFAPLLEIRPSTRVHRLGPLEVADAVALVSEHVASHHRRLPNAALEQLCGLPRSPRWLVVATDLLLKLMAHDYLRIRDDEDRARSDPAQAIAVMLTEVARGLPEDLHELHAEVYRRLAGFSLWVVPTLWIIQASLASFRLDDLIGVLGRLGQEPPAAEMALVRTLLRGNITVDDAIWTFAHESAGEGLWRYIQSSTKAAGTDPMPEIEMAICEHLVTLAVDDPIRVRMLLIALWNVPLSPVLAYALHRPEIAPDEALWALAIWAMSLVEVSLHDPSDVLADLLQDDQSDDELLTSVGFLVAFIMPSLSPADQAELGELCTSVVGLIPDGARDRFGQSPRELAELVKAVVFDPLDALGSSGAGWQDELMNWGSRMQAGAASILDAPRPVLRDGAGALDAGIVWWVETGVVVESAIAIAAELVVRPEEVVSLV